MISSLLSLTVCIEALSCEIDKRMVQSASASVNKLQHAVMKMEKTDNTRLQDEYTRLVEGLSNSFGSMGDRDEAGPSSSSSSSAAAASASSSSAPGRGANRAARSAEETDSLLGSPVLPSELLKESIPGNIRRAHHFLMFLRSWVEFLRKQMRQPEVRQKSTEAFLEELRIDTKISDLKAMKFAYDRLQSLYKTLQITDMDEYNPLTAIVNLATMSAMYKEGFTVIFEPYDGQHLSLAYTQHMHLHCACMNTDLSSCGRVCGWSSFRAYAEHPRSQAAVVLSRSELRHQARV